MIVEVGQMQVYRLKNGRLKFELEIAHNGLRKHKVVKGDDEGVVRRKAAMQITDWEERYAAELDKRRHQRQLEADAAEAERLTTEARDVLANLERTLDCTLHVDDAIDFDDLKNHQGYAEPEPTPPAHEVEPRSDSSAYRPRFGLLDHLIPSRKVRKREESARRFAASHDQWVQARDALEARHADEQKHWLGEKAAFDEERLIQNEKVDALRALYLAKDAGAIEEYCDLVLSNSDYPDFMPQEFNLAYNAETAVLVVDYLLPKPDDLPTLKEVRFVKSRRELAEQHLSQRDRDALYDSLLYQVTLRTIHELYEADRINAIEAIVFNGRVDSIDRATGKDVSACVLTVQAGREEFLGIDLARVDPKACFKLLRGVGSSKLHSITPVAPLIQIDRDDSRFVESRPVVDGLDESTNLAAMGWEDFEHLIRDLFERVFAVGGGEVKVTQASRDGGVDAIAFDPDPIRGGKIVIQAKRYTNTVGVSAVRDLYGTVMNEGATKGILVTTSDFGPDAHSFARDKPISLLSGGNLLHLLQQNGYSARIDIGEAKRLQREADT